VIFFGGCTNLPVYGAITMVQCTLYGLPFKAAIVSYEFHNPIIFIKIWLWGDILDVLKL
jgi:hypothetical protein